MDKYRMHLEVDFDAEDSESAQSLMEQAFEALRTVEGIVKVVRMDVSDR